MKRLLALALLLAIPVVAGHAEPFASQPASGERLDAAPDVAWVDFTEPVFRDGSWIRVTNADGDRVDEDDLRITGDARPRMEVSLQPLPDGAYRIEWQTYSQSDGHTIRGSIGFAVGGFAPPQTTTDAKDELDVLAAGARAVLYAGAAWGLGTLAFRRFVAPLPNAQRALDQAALAATAGTLLLLWDTWQGTGLSFGAYIGSAGGRGFLWRLAFAAWLFARQPRLLLIGWLVFTWLTAGLGHVTREGLLGHALEWLHLLSAAVWVGALWWFLRTMRPETAQEAGARFGRLAQVAVVGLLVSGFTITLALLHDVWGAGLWDDSWTWFLSAKLGLVAVMLAVAWLNRYVFLASTPSAWTSWLPNWGEPVAALRKAVRIEVGASALALVAAGLLLSVSPPSGVAFEEADVERTAQGEAYLGLLQVSPAPSVGPSHQVAVFLTEEATGEPLANNTCGRDDCVRLRWVVDGDPGSEQEVTLVPDGDGWWRADVLFVRSGSTQMEVDVQSAYVYLDTLVFAPFMV